MKHKRTPSQLRLIGLAADLLIFEMISVMVYLMNIDGVTPMKDAF